MVAILLFNLMYNIAVFLFNLMYNLAIILLGVGWLCTSVIISWNIYIRSYCNMNIVRTIIRAFLIFIVFLFLIFIIGTFNIVHCEGIELVRWGEYRTISSHVGIKFTVAERAYWVILNVPPYIQGIVVGLILSDACLRITKGSVNAHLKFNQSTKHFEYFWFVYRLLSPIIQAIPLYYTGTRKDVPFYGIELYTPNLPFLTVLKDLFYINSIKCIPECIYMLLTPIALAHWILGDGTRRGGGMSTLHRCWKISRCL